MRSMIPAMTGSACCKWRMARFIWIYKLLKHGRAALARTAEGGCPYVGMAEVGCPYTIPARFFTYTVTRLVNYPITQSRDADLGVGSIHLAQRFANLADGGIGAHRVYDVG